VCICLCGFDNVKVVVKLKVCVFFFTVIEFAYYVCSGVYLLFAPFLFLCLLVSPLLSLRLDALPHCVLFYFRISGLTILVYSLTLPKKKNVDVLSVREKWDFFLSFRWRCFW
jgi:hypothetical protein